MEKFLQGDLCDNDMVLDKGYTVRDRKGRVVYRALYPKHEL